MSRRNEKLFAGHIFQDANTQNDIPRHYFHFMVILHCHGNHQSPTFVLSLDCRNKLSVTLSLVISGSASTRERVPGQISHILCMRGFLKYSGAQRQPPRRCPWWGCYRYALFIYAQNNKLRDDAWKRKEGVTGGISTSCAWRKLKMKDMNIQMRPRRVGYYSHAKRRLFIVQFTHWVVILTNLQGKLSQF